MRIPAYVLFTKADLVAGFVEFFETLGKERGEWKDDENNKTRDQEPANVSSHLLITPFSSKTAKIRKDCVLCLNRAST